MLSVWKRRERKKDYWFTVRKQNTTWSEYAAKEKKMLEHCEKTTATFFKNRLLFQENLQCIYLP